MYVYVCTCIKVNTDSSDVVRCGQRNLGFPAFHSCDMGNAFFNVSWGCFSINKPISGIQFASELFRPMLAPQWCGSSAALHPRQPRVVPEVRKAGMNATDFNPFPYVNLYPQKITQKS